MMSTTERIEKGLFDSVEVLDSEGVERTVFNVVSVTVHDQYRLGPSSSERFRGGVTIEAGDGGIGEPDAVTPNAADLLELECNVNVAEHDIEVIDPNAEEVDLL